MGGGVTFLATPPNRAMTLSSRGRATDEKATLLRRRCNEARELILMAGESVNLEPRDERLTSSCKTAAMLLAQHLPSSALATAVLCVHAFAADASKP
jgi:hypothetical protein